MPPKKDKGEKKDANAGDKGKGKNDKFKKKKCGAPIATGTVMVQRVLPPTVCCPPPGCPVRFCLPGPGCGRC